MPECVQTSDPEFSILLVDTRLYRQIHLSDALPELQRERNLRTVVN